MPQIVFGLLMGGAVIYWFTGASIQAVVAGAYSAVVFIKKNIKLDKDSASIEDSKRVVEICTRYAQKGMINIFIVVFCFALGLPFLNPYFFIGYLIAIAFFGLFQAIFMANAGGAWDNAKKIVEVDLKMKGTPLHAATVVGDTVGDPFKDTSSVAMNPIIKFTTLFGLLAVEIAVELKQKNPDSPLSYIIGGGLFPRRARVCLSLVLLHADSRRAAGEKLTADMFSKKTAARFRLKRVSVIQRSIQVGWQLRVFFTENVFAPDNLVLRDALADAGPRKALVVLEDSLAQALPGLERQIENYFAAHAAAAATRPPAAVCLRRRTRQKFQHARQRNLFAQSTATTLTGTRISSPSAAARCWTSPVLPPPPRIAACGSSASPRRP